MKLSIKSIADRGNREKERVVLKVTQNTDIGDYVLLRAEFRNGEALSGAQTSYWFQFQEVIEGDLVIVYSKPGASSTKKLETGRTAYFFYWGSASVLWEVDSVGPVLLHSPEWSAPNPSEL